GGRKTVKAGNISSLGKGGILFYPFLDLNFNGILDKGEQMVLLSNVRVSGGRAIISEKDSIVRVSDLNAFVDYVVEFSDYDLDNIAWRFKNKTYQVLVDPNQYKKVYVPVLSVGEVSGMVYLNNNNNTVNGLGRITVQIVDKQDKKVAKTLSERDGYFSYLGLKPGNYTVRIDEKQLKKLEYQSVPLSHNLVIKELIDGDIVDGLDFTLQPKETTSSVLHSEKRILNANKKPNSEEQLQSIKILNKTEVKEEIESSSIQKSKLDGKSLVNDSLNVKAVSWQKPTSNLNTRNENKVTVKPDILEKTKSNINTSFGNIADIDETFFTVQVGVYRNYITAGQLKNLTPIYYEKMPNGTNRYFSGKYNSAEEANKAKKQIVDKGIKGSHVVTIKNGKKLALKTQLLHDSAKMAKKGAGMKGFDFVFTKTNDYA
ncbi:MAG: hypothetical protein GQ525_06675, partial [Draconibacterium sp.]|nr:hypothetical protein [Draconibacterium sp.]